MPARSANARNDLLMGCQIVYCLLLLAVILAAHCGCFSKRSLRRSPWDGPPQAGLPRELSLLKTPLLVAVFASMLNDRQGWDTTRDCQQTWLSHFTSDTAKVAIIA